MIRWMRITAIGLVLLAFIVVGAGVGLLLVENGSGAHAWVPIELHPWLRLVFGQTREAWLPALLAGWLVAILSTGALLFWSMFYVWRRRRYERLIRKMERELISLRNLPFEAPAPFEDQRELPDPEARQVMLAIGRGAPFNSPDRSESE
jgi:hypothetical protein